MKKIKIIFVAIFFIGSFNSCEDSYKILQDGALSPNSVKTVDDLQSVLNNVYAYATTYNEIGFTAIFTDETGTGKGSGGQNFDTHRFQVTAANSYAEAIWFGYYALINRANRLLDEASRINPNPAIVDNNGFTDVQRYNFIIAQAKALRAFAHFQLLTYFSTDLKNDNATGVILLSTVPPINAAYQRNTNGEVFAFIESDLNFAYNNCINYYTTDPYKYVTKRMINALRARMYLYRGNFTLAKQYALDVISTAGGNDLVSAFPVPVAGIPTNPSAPQGTIGSPSSSWNTSFYGGSSTNPYRKMFNDTSQGEIIFALSRPANSTSSPVENIADNFCTNTTNLQGSPYFEVGRNLFNLLCATPGDVRRYANVDPTSLINPNYNQTGVDYIATDVLIIDKYPGKSSYPLRNDLKVFRMSEIYFILAECYVNDGSLNGASNSVASTLKLIRDKRNFINTNQPLPNYASATDALADILLERRIELCFEGHRYIDLKRLGALVNASIDRNATDDEISGLPTTLPITDHRFTLPIPTAEINANPSIQQNPGY